MAETPRTCRRCGEATQADWSFCPYCAMILSDSEPASGTLSDRIRYVRRDAGRPGGARSLTQPLANLAIAVAILLMVGGGIVLFHPALVPSLFRPQEIEIAPLEPAKAPEKDPAGTKAFVPNEWVTIPAGDFQYGPTGNAEELWLPSYQIQKYEVTNHDWYMYLRGERKRLEGEGRWETSIPRHWGIDDPNAADVAPSSDLWDLPVVNITWYQAQDYCQSYLAGLQGCSGARLPSNYEWEKAARGPEDDRPWPWGDDYFYSVEADSSGERWPRANTKEMPNGVPVRVNAYMKDRSYYKVIGMAGNVGEFVGDLSRNYLAWMGGTFQTDRIDAKVYVETPIAPGANHCWSYVGFRAARSLPETESGTEETAPKKDEAEAPPEKKGEEEEER